MDVKRICLACGICINTFGGFKCSCNVGYTGDLYDRGYNSYLDICQLVWCSKDGTMFKHVLYVYLN